MRGRGHWSSVSGAHLGPRLGARRQHPEDAVEIARRFKDARASTRCVSSGQVSKKKAPVYGLFQVPFSDRIRNEVGIPTIAVGNIFETDHVNTIIAAEADLRARPSAPRRRHVDPPRRRQLGFRASRSPNPVRRVRLERNLQRAAQLAVNA
ncbi:MAG: hypothetical protein U0326_05675 [Polyangiales bacterium]